jgi:tripartite-type tricarboxylate transporter receptor subunit TctC
MLKTILFAAALWLAGTATPMAQDYPTHTIKIIVPTGVGGITDLLARMVGNSISDQLGQPVIIDNRPGAGGTIGTRLVAQSPPDGYTLLMAFPSHAANPALYSHLPYDSEKDFAPISMVTKVSEILLVPNSSPARSIPEFIELARKQPLNYASVGVGSLAHLSTELFMSMAHIKMTHIPYRSVPEAQQAVMSGAVAAFFDTPITALPQIKAGTVRALAVTAPKRIADFPDLPTMKESGADVNAIIWTGVFAPKATPSAIVKKLEGEFMKIAKRAEVASRLKAVGVDAVGASTDEFTRILQDDITRWGEVVKASNIKIEQ